MAEQEMDGKRNLWIDLVREGISLTCIPMRQTGQGMFESELFEVESNAENVAVVFEPEDAMVSVLDEDGNWVDPADLPKHQNIRLVSDTKEITVIFTGTSPCHASVVKEIGICSCPNGEVTASCAVSVCLPIQVTPTAVVGSPMVGFCGQPVITPGAKMCPGTKNGSCYFTVSQTMCVSVPVCISADVHTGEPGVTCLGNRGAREGGQDDCSCMEDVELKQE